MELDDILKAIGQLYLESQSAIARQQKIIASLQAELEKYKPKEEEEKK